MAVQPYPYLVITDGSTTVTFADGAGGQTNYPQQRGEWAPKVAGRRASTMMGLEPYNDVTEEMRIMVRNTTAALCLSNLATLARLLDQAEQWWRQGAPVNPVQIKYAPQGSTLASNATPYVATVLGRASGDETSGVTLPITFDEVGLYYTIDNIRLRFVRTGIWTLGTETGTASGVTNPSVLSVTMPSSPTIVGPTQLSITGFTTGAGGTVDIPSGYMMVGPTIDMQQAETPFSTNLATNATFTNIGDAGARASNNFIAKVDHSLAAVGAESVLNYLPTLVSTTNLIAVFCTYRNNTASAWTLQASAGYGVLAAAPLTATYGPLIVIPGVATNPTVLYLGTIGNRYGIQWARLHITCTSIVGLCTLDFDTVVFVDLSNGDAFVINVNGARANIGINSEAAQVVVNNDPSTLQVPDARINFAGGNRIPQVALGTTAINTKGSPLKALWYATHLYNGATPYWTTQNILGSAIAFLGATIVRKPGRLTPE